MRRGAWASALVIAGILSAATPALAVERFVKPDADPTCLALPSCYTTIAAAVAALGNGDTITIGHNAGTAYSGNVTVGGFTDVTLRGQPGGRPTIQANPVTTPRSSTWRRELTARRSRT